MSDARQLSPPSYNVRWLDDNVLGTTRTLHLDEYKFLTDQRYKLDDAVTNVKVAPKGQHKGGSKTKKDKKPEFKSIIRTRRQAQLQGETVPGSAWTQPQRGTVSGSIKPGLIYN